ncbi:MAG: App1 family protein [Bacteroidales bacterium]|nr:App1 family protein [Bacteroidales bacterium]
MVKKQRKSIIVPHYGFSNGDETHVKGHAFRNYQYSSHERQSVIKNVLQMINRYQLIPVRNAEIEITVKGVQKNVTTDRSGFFSATLPVSDPKTGWQDYTCKFTDDNTIFPGSYRVCDAYDTAVISDIDDTLLITHTTNIIRMISLVMLKNAFTRKATPQLGDIFKYVEELSGESLPQDFFYVSNSEWNLYDFLTDFFRHNNFPEGIFLLQPLRIGMRDVVLKAHKYEDHKPKSIKHLLNFFPQKPFIFVGDNSHRDLEIYAAIGRQFPDRIKGVIVRELKRDKYRRRNLVYYDKLRADGIPVKIVSQ